jgi:hypothetical protein
MVGDILIWIMIIIRIVIGVSLTRAALRQNVRNLLWLGAVFFANGLFTIFSFQAWDSPFLFHLGILLAQVCLVLFIQQTFYRGRRSPWGMFMAITLVGGLVDLWIDAGSSIEISSNTPMYVVTSCNWLWHTVIAYQAYRAAVRDRAVEDWVKARYRLMIAYCCITVLVTILALVQLVLGIPPGALTAVQVLFVIGSIVLQYLVWVMPERFRQYLNRNYQPSEFEAAALEQSEEEIMRQLQGE